MKKLTLLFAVFALTFACSKTDEEIEAAFVPDPTIIREYHTLDQQGNINEKYIFDQLGRLSEYYKTSDDFILEFEYEVNDRLSSISKKDLNGNLIETPITIIYDSNNKVTSISDRTFSFDQDENRYMYGSGEWNLIEIITDDFGNDVRWESLSYLYYEINPENIVRSYNRVDGEREVVIETGELLYEYSYTTFSWRIGYENNNLMGFSDTELTNVDYEYDNSINPLYFETSNLEYIYTLFVDGDYGQSIYSLTHITRPLISINNKVSGLSAGPSSFEVEYELNDLSLPIQEKYLFYYFGSYDGSRIVGKYYYQGDEIPE